MLMVLLNSLVRKVRVRMLAQLYYSPSFRCGPWTACEPVVSAWTEDRHEKRCNQLIKTHELGPKAHKASAGNGPTR